MVSTAGLARNHIITVSESKLLTIAGGKWTTYRCGNIHDLTQNWLLLTIVALSSFISLYPNNSEMAEEAVDRAINEFKLTPRNDCVTTNVYLIGAKDWTPTMFIKLIQNYGIQREVREKEAPF